jgi:hypothetical protein
MARQAQIEPQRRRDDLGGGSVLDAGELGDLLIGLLVGMGGQGAPGHGGLWILKVPDIP